MGALLHTGRSAANVGIDATAAPLNKEVAEYYDEACLMPERARSEHVHLGFYEPGATASDAVHRAAQIRMDEEALRFAGVSDDPLKRPKSIVDVGCGIGGCSRYLANKYGAKCVGFTISPVEAGRAQALAAAEGSADQVSFQVADALEQPFPDGQFDLVWSMTSAEHMNDKRKFMSELARVAAPGGTIAILSWCHRELLPSEDSLRPDELNFLKKFGDTFYSPIWWSAADYEKTAQSMGLQDIKSADLTENVAPCLAMIKRNMYSWQRLLSMLTGWKAIKQSFMTSLLIEGNNKGLLKFNIITCRKP